MQIKSLYNSNAVLENPSNGEVLDSFEFNFLNYQIKWESKPEKIGKEVVLGIDYENEGESEKVSLALKRFASLVVFRNQHIENFEERTSLIFSSKGSVGQSIAFAMFDPNYLLKLNEDSYDEKIWSMLSFYLEYKNSSSIYYKFICLYKILEINNTRIQIKNGKSIITEDTNAVSRYINTNIKNVLDQNEHQELSKRISRSRLKDKSFGGYFKHMLRDSFSHTGFLTKNNYKYGYPALNPYKPSDILKFHKGVNVFDQLAYNILNSLI